MPLVTLQPTVVGKTSVTCVACVQSQTDMSATSTTLRAEKPRAAPRPRAPKRSLPKQQARVRQAARGVPVAAQPMHGTQVRGGPIFVVPAGANAWSYVNANYFQAAGGHIEASGTSRGTDSGHAMFAAGAPIVWDRATMTVARPPTVAGYGHHNEASTLPPLSAGPPPPAALQGMGCAAMHAPAVPLLPATAAMATQVPATSSMCGLGTSESTNSDDVLDFSIPDFFKVEDDSMLLPSDEEVAAAAVHAVLGQDSMDNLFAGMLPPTIPICPLLYFLCNCGGLWLQVAGDVCQLVLPLHHRASRWSATPASDSLMSMLRGLSKHTVSTSLPLLNPPSTYPAVWFDGRMVRSG